MQSIYYLIIFIVSSFSFAQDCQDDDEIISTGLSVWTEVSGCQEAYTYINSQGLNCLSQLNMPFVSANPITLASICCQTCDEFIVDGCIDPTACNFNSQATTDDGSCVYGEVECFVSPCSVSENPGVDEAYCVDDYCNGCCAVWFYPDDTLLSNDCENLDNGNQYIGNWYSEDIDGENEYLNINETEITIFEYEEDENCFFEFSIEYNYLGEGLISIVGPEFELINIYLNILENGQLQVTQPDGNIDEYNPVNEIPNDLTICDYGQQTGEGCNDIQGQWTYMNYVWMVIDEDGAQIITPSDDPTSLCFSIFDLSYSQINQSDTCELFYYESGESSQVSQMYLNSDGTLTFINMDSSLDFPLTWNTDNTNLTGINECIYGCTDPFACNYDVNANADNETCGLIDDCGECQTPYCYDLSANTIDYISFDECETDSSPTIIWISNDCENNAYCLSSQENLFWNASCISIYENILNSKTAYQFNLLGQNKTNNMSKGLNFIIYKSGLIEKKYVISNE